MASSDLELLRASVQDARGEVKELQTAVSGHDGLRERTRALEVHMGSVKEKLDDVGEKLDTHMTSSGGQHTALSGKVDALAGQVTAMDAKFATLATKDDLKAQTGILSRVDPGTAKTIGLILAAFAVAIATALGFSGLSPDTAAAEKPRVEVVAPTE